MSTPSPSEGDKARWNPWPLGIIGVFVIFITATIGLIIFACSQRVELVGSDYYDQEIRFQGQLERANRAQALPHPATIRYDTPARCVRVALPELQREGPVTGLISFYRPSAAGLDRQFALQLDENGSQSVDVAALAPGFWRVRVSWTAAAKNYFIEQSVVIKAASTASL